jgi:Zn-dependent protease
MDWILQIPILLFSLIVHEFSHGFTAYHHGDDTAALSGRLSFNPLDHIDPIGTLLIPAICIFNHVPLFGWAKPVPVNPAMLREPRRDQLKVAAAGPLSNILLSAAAALAYRLVARFSGLDIVDTLLGCFIFAVEINLLLAFFNLIPIFPLDGSKVLAALLPTRWLLIYEEHQPYGGLLIMVLVMTGLTNWFIVPGMNLFIGLYQSLHLLPGYL